MSLDEEMYLVEGRSHAEKMSLAVGTSLMGESSPPT
jgi:hypothetical protein